MTENEWTDCRKFLPYRDYEGRWRWPSRTQKRTAIIEGRTVVQYRERAETADEYWNRQW